jgi:tetratricopeptide (TPR) repeat protein
MSKAPITSGRFLLSLDNIKQFFSAVRSIFVDGLLVALAVIIVSYLVFERNQAKVEAIFTPKPLEDLGFTSDIAVQHLMKAIDKIESEAQLIDPGSVQIESQRKLIKPLLTIVPASQEINFSIPNSGISLESLIRQLRVMIGRQETTIAGEFICESAHCNLNDYRLELFVTGELPEILDQIGPTSNWNEYFYHAAQLLLRKLDPSVVASALYHSHKDEALDVAKEMISNNHGDKIWAINLIGAALNSQGNYDGTIDYFHKAAEFDPQFEEALDSDAQTKWGDALNNKRHYDEAIKHYTKATELNPNFAYAYLGWGDALHGKRDYDGAIKHYTKAVELDPKLVTAHVNWGNALADKHDYDEAIKHYTKATELVPKLASSTTALAYAYVAWGDAVNSKGDPAEAIKHYTKAVELDPKLALAYVGWGNALSDKRDYEGALERYRTALELEPKLAWTYVGLGGALSGEALRDKHDYDAAFGAFAKAAELDPNQETDLYVVWGHALSEKEDYDGAIAKYDKQLALEQDDPDALDGRAWAYAHNHELDKALADAERAALAPKDASPVRTRGWIYLNKAQSDGSNVISDPKKPLDLALVDFDKALSLGPSPGACAGRGRALELKGEREKAIAAYRKTLSMEGGSQIDDNAKAEASQHLSELGASIREEGIPQQPEPQTPEKSCS